jgi:hypothetical protein
MTDAREHSGIIDMVTSDEPVSFGVYGINDSSQQLSPEQIVALKDRLRHDRPLLAQVAAQIATNMLAGECVPWSQIDVLHGEGEDAVEFIGEDGAYPDEHAFGRNVGGVAVHWGLHLYTAVQLPNDSWPVGYATPATFADALRQVDTLNALGMER